MRRFPLALVPALAACTGLLLFASGLRASAAPAVAVTSPHVEEVRLTLAVPVDGRYEILEAVLFALDDGTAPIASRIEEGRQAWLARFPGAIELEPAEVSAQFTLFGIRWRDPSTSWRYNPAGATGSLSAGDALAAIKAGADAWNGAGGTPWQFNHLGTTTTAPGCNGVPTSIPADSQNVVGWGFIAGGYLGYTCWWRSSSLVDGTPYFEATEFDIVFQPNYAYSAASLRALAVHEFGHGLGLDHTESALCPGQAMCAGADAMTYISPRSDDLLGLIALYGYAPTPAATATSTATPTLTPTPTSTPPATPSPGPPGSLRVVLPAVARD